MSSLDSELSPLDKAYVTINYPFPAGTRAPTDWTLLVALDVAAVPADVASEISRLAHAPSLDVSEIRSRFAHWAQDAHHTLHAEMSLELPAVHDPIQALPDAKPDVTDVVRSSQSITSMSDCGTSSSDAEQAVSGAQHAVVLEPLLWELEDGPEAQVNLEYCFVNLPTPYQIGLLTTAMEDWQNCSAVRFVRVPPLNNPPLLIKFVVDNPNSVWRSHVTGLGTRTRREANRSVGYTVLLRLCQDDAAAEDWDRNNPSSTPARDRNLRSCLHEVCLNGSTLVNAFLLMIYAARSCSRSCSRGQWAIRVCRYGIF